MSPLARLLRRQHRPTLFLSPRTVRRIVEHSTSQRMTDKGWRVCR